MSDSTSTIVSRIPGRDTTSGQALRFIALGCFNTGATIVGFYLLSGVVSPHLAFTIIYAAGIAFVVLVTPGYVFGARAPWSRRATRAARAPTRATPPSGSTRPSPR